MSKNSKLVSGRGSTEYSRFEPRGEQLPKGKTFRVNATLRREVTVDQKTGLLELKTEKIALPEKDPSFKVTVFGLGNVILAEWTAETKFQVYETTRAYVCEGKDAKCAVDYRGREWDRKKCKRHRYFARRKFPDTEESPGKIESLMGRTGMPKVAICGPTGRPRRNKGRVLLKSKAKHVVRLRHRPSGKFHQGPAIVRASMRQHLPYEFILDEQGRVTEKRLKVELQETLRGKIIQPLSPEHTLPCMFWQIIPFSESFVKRSDDAKTAILALNLRLGFAQSGRGARDFLATEKRERGPSHARNWSELSYFNRTRRARLHVLAGSKQEPPFIHRFSLEQMNERMKTGRPTLAEIEAMVKQIPVPFDPPREPYHGWAQVPLIGGIIVKRPESEKEIEEKEPIRGEARYWQPKFPFRDRKKE